MDNSTPSSLGLYVPQPPEHDHEGPAAGRTCELDALGEIWIDAVAADLEYAHELRRRIHSQPEVSGSEDATAELVSAELSELLTLWPIARTGRIGRLGPVDGPAVGIRAELDALPLVERTGASFASTNSAMHACGHDVHMAALVTLLRAVRTVRERTGADLPVALAPVFQPREETYPSGALDIVSEMGLERWSIAHMIGVHNHPGVAAGEIAIGDGYINAAADEVHITVHGRGGHGAYPHDAADPVAGVSNIALALPEIVRRTIGPMSAAVVSIGTIRVGEGAANVLPQAGHISATVRTTSAEDRTRIRAAIKTMAEGIAVAYGLEAEVRLVDGEPVLLNDAELAARFARRAEGLGAETAEPMRSLGADDFSFFSQAVPSAMSFVGTGQPGVSLHDATYLPPERAVFEVARAMIAGYLAGAESLLASADD
ncbi:amidohydrolase [Brevibacterium sanguinis]|uniref:Amidohydrolase n=2 Tax=Brevibacterium TaxID=1696 RepID=A0A366IP50_9MICO|nr:MULTISPECIES: M20 family metallopeptidase [Brevibacterium]RBP67025.1 amidohydrolase [Brevibacterium sanguinis]RBP73550.1 amidohydrolase [Brevibacterium celere]